MVDTEQLSHVIELVNDESSDVRRAVREELSRYGPSLKERVEELDPPPSPEQREALQSIMKNQCRKRLLTLWPDWVKLSDGVDKLEEGYELLADYQTGYIYSDDLAPLLDNVAEQYRNRYSETNVFQLATFLFEEKELRGDREDYYHPKNSNVLHALKEQKGLPITLSAIFKLVGHRLNLRIEGCNVPGHFLTRAYTGEDFVLIDAFNTGRQVEKEKLIRQYEQHVDRSSIRRLLQTRISSEAWFRRVLNNLIRAYRKKGHYQEAQLMSMLDKYVDRHHEKSCDPEPIQDEYFSTLDPAYVPGQLVRHHRGQFRGVIVDFDLNCRGSKSWYQSSRPRPYREQPWYAILIDGSEEAKYMAESVLEPDPGIDRVHNPNVKSYFRMFRNGFYVRNDQSWMEQRP